MANSLDQILTDLLDEVQGARATIFLDNEGEAIAHAGDDTVDIRMTGAWKEIHLDHIKDISNRLGTGNVDAVLFSLDQGNELIAPVAEDYCLLLLMSSYTDIRQAMAGIRKASERLKKDIE